MRAIKIIDVMIDLLGTMRSEQVVCNTMSGPFTARQMRDMLIARDHIALQWGSDYLRVTRDIFKMMAENGKTVTGVTPEHIAQARQVDKKAFISLLNEVPKKTTIVFWSPEHGRVVKAEMLKALAENNPLSTAYIACFVHYLEQQLSSSDQVDGEEQTEA